MCLWHPSGYTVDVSVQKSAQIKAGEVIVALRLLPTAPSADGQSASITLLLSPERFELQKLSFNAPTGVQSPPAMIRFGPNTFYYYGKGGGGVAYPDVFYFNLRSQLLTFVFDSPYLQNENSPDTQTKRMEKTLLSGFRASTH